MKYDIPFLRPCLPPREAYSHYLAKIDENRIYSNYGPLNGLFEQRIISDYFGQGAAVTVANATIGLMLSISALKRPGGRYALMPSFTFAATPLAAQWCGLEPYFVDIDSEDWCMDQSLLESTLRELGDEVAVVVPYATFGTAMDLAPYASLHRKGTPVVVDAAPCFGTTNEGRQLGAGFPGCVVFSFHATKAFGIGEGGLIYSGDVDLIKHLRQAGNFGFSENRESESQGLNGKMSEFTAAVALAMLNTFPGRVAKRQQLQEYYLQQFHARGLLNRKWGMQTTRGKIPFQFQSAVCPPGTNRERLLAACDAKGIQLRTYFSPPSHVQSQFRRCPATGMTVTEAVSDRVISLPLWEEMDETHIDRILDVLVEETWQM